MRNLMKVMVLALGATSVGAWAAPTAQVQGGMTSLVLSEAVTQALVTCELERIKPAVIKPGGERLRFKIGSGALDLETFAGELEHRGGVTLGCDGGANVVGLQNFRIDNLGEGEPGGPVVTALASVNGSVTGRIALFVPVGEEIEPDVSGGKVLRLRGVSLVLADEAEQFLLEHLGLSLPADAVIGESYTRITLRSERGDDSGDDEESDGPGKGKAKGKDKDKDKSSDEEDDEDDVDEKEEEEVEEETEEKAEE